VDVEDIDRILNIKPKLSWKLRLENAMHSPWTFPLHIIALVFGVVGTVVYTVFRHILPNLAMMIFTRGKK